MDWQTILTSITASSIIAAGVGYIIKRSFDKTLELQFEKFKEQNKAIIQEDVRRQAFLYDRQYETLKLLLSLTYRLRNKARDLPHKIESRTAREIEKEFRGIFVIANALEELLYTDRATLPNFIFDIAHDLKTYLAKIDLEISRNRRNPREDNRRILDDVQQLFEYIDERYALLTAQVHNYLGVSESDATPNKSINRTRNELASHRELE
jgi:hypothetical protein